MTVVISSGHGKYVGGAVGPEPWGLNEVTEARNVVESVAAALELLGEDVVTFHDDASKSQDENLEAIVDFHNNNERSLDVSIHFNAFEVTDQPRGTEVLYVSDDVLAEQMAEAIAEAGGFINRGSKFRDDLYFLNNTDMPAILIEVCFVDSKADVELYRDNFDAICAAIAQTLADFI